MNQMLKIECKRAFLGWPFLIVLTIGTLISLSHIYNQVLPWYPINPAITNPEALTPFTKWIGLDAFSFEAQLLLLLLPLTVTIPFADAYLIDRKSGFIKNIYTRVDRKNYIISKFIATFLSGGVSFLLPLLLHLLFVSLLLPSVYPDPTNGLGALTDNTMWSELFYSSPYTYILFYLIIDFLYAGLFAIMGLAASIFIRKQFAVLTLPFLLYIFLFFTFQLVGYPAFIPFKFLSPGQTVLGITLFHITIEFLILFGLSTTVYFTGALKHEIY